MVNVYEAVIIFFLDLNAEANTLIDSMKRARSFTPFFSFSFSLSTSLFFLYVMYLYVCTCMSIVPRN